MNNVRLCLTICAITLVLACAVQSAEAGRPDWRNSPAVKDYLRGRPVARKMTEGPLGGILDLIIDIILILLDIILGGALAPMQTQMSELQEQVKQMGALMGQK